MKPISIAVVLAACGGAPLEPAGGPRGLRASEHRAEARQHVQRAQEASSRPSYVTWAPGTLQPVGSPWYRSYEIDENYRAADVHLATAAELEAAFDKACADRPAAEIRISPLARYATGSWNTQVGVIVYLSTEAGPPEHLVGDIECHRAWMMLSPSDMENCPLDMPGLAVDARGDATGITLSVAVRDPKLVPELQRRIAYDLEAHHASRK